MIPHWEDNHEWIFIKIRNIWKISEIKKRNKDEKIYIFFFYLFYIFHIDYVKSYLIPKMKSIFTIHENATPQNWLKRVKKAQIMEIQPALRSYIFITNEDET